MATPNQGDGEWVVVQGGQRVSGLIADEQAAIQEAARRNKVAESAGQPAPAAPAEIKQNILG